MAFIRHVGKQGDRKVAVVFREVPGDPHMCLIVYTELLNQNIHDPLMTTIESDIGQNSDNLADALNRTYTKDGKVILQVLHSEGMLKRVQTESVVMTPAPNTSIKLSELNNLLNEMQKGSEATKKLAEIDSSMGYQDPKDVAKRRDAARTTAKEPVKASTNQALDDSSLANNLRQQAERMSREAQGLLAESERLLSEANKLDPVVTEVKTKKAKKSKVSA